MSAPTPVRAVERPAIVVDHGWWRIVIHWPVDNLGALYHLRTLPSWPVGRRRGSVRLRHAAAHVECGLDGEAFLVLPANLAPAFIAPTGIDATAARNFCNHLPPRPRRRPHIY